jgi:hypothetical protein
MPVNPLQIALITLLALLYIGGGLYLMAQSATPPNMTPVAKNIFAAILTLYGLYRMYRAINQWKAYFQEQNED